MYNGAIISGIGEFTCDLANLVPGTIYNASAYIAWGLDLYFESYNYSGPIHP